MKSFNSVFWGIGIGLMLMFLPSCNENEAEYESFLIEVQSIHLPEDITVGQPFTIAFTGTVGNNGCYRFSHFETKREGNDIVIEAWGQLNISSDVCPEVMVYLDEELSYQIDEEGSYTVKVKLPDGELLEEQFLVE